MENRTQKRKEKPKPLGLENTKEHKLNGKKKLGRGRPNCLRKQKQKTHTL